MKQTECIAALQGIDDQEQEGLRLLRLSMTELQNRNKDKRVAVLNDYGKANARYRKGDVLQIGSNNMYIKVTSVTSSISVNRNTISEDGYQFFVVKVVYKGDCLRKYKGELVPLKRHPRGVVYEGDARLTVIN